MRIVKIILLVLIFSLVAIAGYVGYVKWALPDIALRKEVKIPTDSASIAHGKYLANSVAVCIDSIRKGIGLNWPGLLCWVPKARVASGLIKMPDFPVYFSQKILHPTI